MSYIATKNHPAWKERVNFENYLSRLHDSYNTLGTPYSASSAAKNAPTKSHATH